MINVTEYILPVHSHFLNAETIISCELEQTDIKSKQQTYYETIVHRLKTPKLTPKMLIINCFVIPYIVIQSDFVVMSITLIWQNKAVNVIQAVYFEHTVNYVQRD